MLRSRLYRNRLHFPWRQLTGRWFRKPSAPDRQIGISLDHLHQPRYYPNRRHVVHQHHCLVHRAPYVVDYNVGQHFRSHSINHRIRVRECHGSQPLAHRWHHPLRIPSSVCLQLRPKSERHLWLYLLRLWLWQQPIDLCKDIFLLFSNDLSARPADLPPKPDSTARRPVFSIFSWISTHGKFELTTTRPVGISMSTAPTSCKLFCTFAAHPGPDICTANSTCNKNK